MTFEFHPEALAEFEDAARYYTSRQPGAGLRFVASVEEAIDRILEAPLRWRILETDIRRCLTRVFPYAVLYTIEPEFVLIIAVMHCHREPGYWRERVSPLSS
jgi:plasmid stabilization system protein ParE